MKEQVEKIKNLRWEQSNVSGNWFARHVFTIDKSNGYEGVETFAPIDCIKPLLTYIDQLEKQLLRTHGATYIFCPDCNTPMSGECLVCKVKRLTKQVAELEEARKKQLSVNMSQQTKIRELEEENVELYDDAKRYLSNYENINTLNNLIRNETIEECAKVAERTVCARKYGQEITGHHAATAIRKLKQEGE